MAIIQLNHAIFGEQQTLLSSVVKPLALGISEYSQDCLTLFRLIFDSNV
ncbi:MAG: hypothetical protein U1E91_02575 [Moraxella sp.]|nr:hypothetical protein [Moraxella osloensis]